MCIYDTGIQYTNWIMKLKKNMLKDMIGENFPEVNFLKFILKEHSVWEKNNWNGMINNETYSEIQE